MTRSATRTIKGAAAVLLGTAVLIWSGAAFADLASLRTERREALKSAEGPQHFVLLVIPVDFSDARLDPDWSPGALSQRLVGDGETFENYYRIASAGRMELRTLLAPVVHLEGERRDYSDLGYSGAFRTRALARESILGASERLPLRLADGDGPDGRPGTADDDGEVDGVLILHAAPGLENDPVDGRIVPLQYWLDDPVVEGGTVARLYSVSSMHSGLGVWLHESAHLLGLEDRYDLSLGPADGAAAAADFGRGGLGRFSLMAMGHMGNGDGSGAALLDAYSAIQLGWTQAVRLVSGSGSLQEVIESSPAAGAWRFDAGDDEYFLMETRGESEDHPFDAGIPSGRMIVYHVDESIADDASGGTPEHLRVRLVEADGDDDVSLGDGPGEDDDLFPSDGSSQDWTPTTIPSTSGYQGPTGASWTSIETTGEGLDASWSVVLEGLWVSPRFSVADGDTLLDVFVEHHPATSDSVRITLTALAESGVFAGEPEISVLMAWHPSAWHLPSPATWTPATGVEGLHTRLAYSVRPDTGPTSHGTWSYRWYDDDLFSFAEETMDEGWTTGQEGSATTSWRLWPASALGLSGDEVMACTGDGSTPQDWPHAVSYTNNADAWLTTPAFRPSGGGVRLIHHFDLAPDYDGVGPDGAVVEVLRADGSIVPIVPVDGYTGSIPSAGLTDLVGRDAFVDAGGIDEDDAPLWRVDDFPLLFGDEDLRLRFRLVSDPAWRGRGWFMHSLNRVDAARSHVPVLDEGAWRLPDWLGPSTIAMQSRRSAEDAWGPMIVNPDLDGAAVDATLGEPGRHELRFLMTSTVTGLTLALRPVAHVVPGERDLLRALAPPWPNPATTDVSFSVSVPSESASARLVIYDLRGRTVRTWTVGPGTRVLSWDGRDDEGRPTAAGRYLIRLDGPDIHETESVTLLP